jgi:hypothetical protein
MRRMVAGICAVLVSFTLLASMPAVAQTAEELASRAIEILSRVESRRQPAIDFFLKRGKSDAAPVFVDALRFERGQRAREIVDALERLTGARSGQTWNEWMVWQEMHPETGVIPGYGAFKGTLLSFIDVNFRRFVNAGVKHEIRLEEIAWGGVLVDGIPSLDAPQTVPAAAAPTPCA